MSRDDRQFLNELLDAPDVRVSLLRQVIDVTPPHAQWKEHKAGRTVYVVVSVGPEDIHVENCIRLALGFDVMQLKK